MATTIAKRVRAFLEEQGAQPRPGLTPDDIQAAEARLRVRLPEDVARFFEIVNGTSNTSGFLFEMWPLERMGSVPEVVAPHGGIPDYRQIDRALPRASEYFAFADAMIWSHVFAVRIAEGAPTEVVSICGSSFTSVAPTFSAFWQRFLADPDATTLGITGQSAAG